jgi:membrane protein implicated in regulation of membrane protease activity
MEIFDFLSNPWVIWFLIGLLFMLLEFMMPGLIVMFFGIGAWITAFCTGIFGLDLNGQLVVFIGTSILSLIFLRKYLKPIFVGKNEEAIDEILEEFLGKTVTAETDFSAGKIGNVSFKGTNWQAFSEENIKKGEQLKIVGKDSIKLKVAKLNKN